ncbi:MAG: hypothetical protein KQH63_03350 [Desulfobulbaceae bacterium]|nr:hypothetical protein [Desulfobulbaceae bacterium]
MTDVFFFLDTRLVLVVKRIIAIGFLVVLANVGQASAAVTGSCSNCHTMHNSQDAQAIVHAGETPGSHASWDGGSLTGGTDTTPRNTLLISDCVGCHSNTGSATIVTLGPSRIPIVNNLDAPVNPLAGGNFYYVVTNGDSYGHNVRGISNADATLAYGPGQKLGCANSCHTSLTLTDADTVALMDGGRKNGCQGCHQSVRHHGSQTAGQPVTSDGGWYRFLSAPSGHLGFGGGVHGIEDPDWEQNPTSSTHNTYYGGDNTNLQEEPQSIGRFCAGCHYQFHSPGVAFDMVDNGGGVDPWLRHPANFVIPNEYEYTSYTEYDPMVPVGRPEKTDIADVDPTSVRPGTDKVICLSCHRAHGSPYPDMLRWDYDTCVTGNEDASCGCFTCHSTKDE